MTQEDELELFAQMMTDVRPISQDKAVLQKQHNLTDAHIAKQEAAVHLSESDPEYLSIDSAPMLKPDGFLEFKRSGVQEGVYRKLRLGKYPLQARLDLHRKSLKEARDEVLKFLGQCQRLDVRTVIIVHGKGERSTPRP